MFDVNVLGDAGFDFQGMSAWPSVPPIHTGNPAADCLALVTDLVGDWALWSSPHILNTTAHILRTKYNWDQEDAQEWVETLDETCRLSGGGVVDPPRSAIDVSGDPEDDRVLDLVAAVKADVLATDDGRDLIPLDRWRGCRVLEAYQFVEMVVALRSAPRLAARKPPRRTKDDPTSK